MEYFYIFFVRFDFERAKLVPELMDYTKIRKALHVIQSRF